ncbi:efflux RND transporter periplasmic adaptor subunit [[Haemophilus] felis]|nr:efflux RND transporter periplasmic adaptor subunit [[Haemophilus] felis]
MNQPQIIKQKPSHVFLMKLVLGVIVLLFVGVMIFNVVKTKMIEKYIANMGEKAFPVTAMLIEPQDWTPVIEATGLVRANQGAMLSAQIPGVVSEILVKSGQEVKKGDVLVSLDSRVEMANLKASQAQLASVEATYKRYVALFKTKSVSQQELDNAKSAYQSLVSNIEAAKSAIERRQIVAPFDGKTGIVKVNVGQFVGVGTEMVRLEDTSSMKIDFGLSQNLLEQLHLGQKITAIADARAGEIFNAEITTIEPAVNNLTGLIDVQAVFDPKDSSKLLSGMFTRLRIALPTVTDQIVVPQVAVNYNMYGEIAYVLTPLSEEEREAMASRPEADKLYRVKQIIVNTKDRQGIYAQLQADGIKMGDMLVTSGQQNLANGSLVKLVDKQAVGTEAPAKKSKL